MQFSRIRIWILSQLFSILICQLGLAETQNNVSKPTVLLTGGTGYIASHVAVVLLQSGYDVVLLNHLSNSTSLTVAQFVVSQIEKAADAKVKAFYPYDLLDKKRLEEVFTQQQVAAVIHLAGYKVPAESINEPLRYYENNLASTTNLLEVMSKYGCHKLIFSSSAAVYGEPKYLPIDELHPTQPSHPYARTKLMIEEILRDVVEVSSKNQFISLRYFNPVGAHRSGLIGERSKGVPPNLVPYLLEVVQGKRPYLTVFGDDYETEDGTAVRDYIHIMDLADGHVLALESLFDTNQTTNSYRTYNLGTGRGYSVMEMIDEMARAWGKPIPFVIANRRKGDKGIVYSDPKKARDELGFVAKRSLSEMMEDSLIWVGALVAQNGQKTEL